MGNSVDHLSSGKTVESREVVTKYGKLIGRRLEIGNDKQVDLFLGVPYAKPPNGKRRFKVPL